MNKEQTYTAINAALTNDDSILPRRKKYPILAFVVKVLSYLLVFALGNWWGFAEGVIWQTAKGG